MMKSIAALMIATVVSAVHLGKPRLLLEHQPVQKRSNTADHGLSYPPARSPPKAIRDRERQWRVHLKSEELPDGLPDPKPLTKQDLIGYNNDFNYHW